MLGNGVRERLESHPKLVATLFTVVVLLSQAGMAVAGDGGAGVYTGP